MPSGKCFCQLMLTLVFMILGIQVLLYYKDSGFQRALFFVNSANGSLFSVNVYDSLKQEKMSSSAPTTIANKTITETSTHNKITDTIPNTIAIKTTVTETQDFYKEINRKCLEYLLKNEVVEYYYPPSNDDTYLNFSIKGIVANAKLGPNFPEPLLALRNPPPQSNYDEKLVPRAICSESLVTFLPSITSAEYDTYRNLFKFFKHIAKLINLPYYLDYGSLLGHIRFNGRPSPWDDDMDIAIDYSKRSLFEKTWALERKKLNLTGPVPFSPQISSFRFKDRIKMFDERSPKMVQFKYPFIDIFFFQSGVEDFYDVPGELLTVRKFSDAFYSSYTQNLPIETMLPFKHERFLGLKLNVPARPKDFLKEMNYVISFCISVSYSHRYEKNTKSKANVPCKTLRGFYDPNVLE